MSHMKKAGMLFLFIVTATVAVFMNGCNNKENNHMTSSTPDGFPESVEPFKGTAGIGNSVFYVEFNSYTGGLNKLVCQSDETYLNYVAGLDNYGSRSMKGDKWFGDVDISYKKKSAEYREVSTSFSYDIRETTRVGQNGINVIYGEKSSVEKGLEDIKLKQKWLLSGDVLRWETEITNSCPETITLGSVSFPMMFNSALGGTQEEMYEKYVYNHSFVGYTESYFYACRNSGCGPVLLLYPVDGTSVEFQYWRGNLNCSSMYVIAGNSQEEYPDSSYLDLHTQDLAPGESITYTFEMRWCESTDDISTTREAAGKTGFLSMPGMVTSTDLPVSLALFTGKKISKISGQFADKTEIKEIETLSGTGYSISFQALGQNIISLDFTDGSKTALLYFVTEPLEELIEKNTAFISEHQQETDESDPCYMGFLPWDMVMADLTGDGLLDSDNFKTDGYSPTGWWHYGGDEMGFSPALYLSLKNVYSPDLSQIKKLVDYINIFVYGAMTEEFDDGTYRLHRGAPWYIMGEWPDDPRIDRKLIRTNFDCWRSYNYLHVINTYYNMYRIAALYKPDIDGMLSPGEYLKRAYDLVYTFFTKWMYPKGDDERGQGGIHYGNMGETMFPEIAVALKKEGFTEEYEWMVSQLAAKADYFAIEKYPYSAEGGFDTAAYESVMAYALYSGNRQLADDVARTNIATRGQTPVWYLYGSDLPSQDRAVNLRYMTQLGGWSLLLHALSCGGERRESEIRLAYGSYMAGWSLINSGYYSQSEYNIGSSVWYYQGVKGNYMESANSWERILPVYNGAVAVSGESALGFWAGLSMASTIVSNDSVFGLYAYGGLIEFDGNLFAVTPKDGVRKRIHWILDENASFELLQDRIEKIVFDKKTETISVTVENAAGTGHESSFIFTGFDAEAYVIEDGNEIPCYSDGNTFSFTFNSDSAVIQITAK